MPSFLEHRGITKGFKPPASGQIQELSNTQTLLGSLLLSLSEQTLVNPLTSWGNDQHQGVRSTGLECRLSRVPNLMLPLLGPVTL